MNEQLLTKKGFEKTKDYNHGEDGEYQTMIFYKEPLTVDITLQNEKLHTVEVKIDDDFWIAADDTVVDILEVITKKRSS